MHLVCLVYLLLKLLPEPVPAQRALAGARFHIPQTDRADIAMTDETVISMTVPMTGEKATDMTKALHNHSNHSYSLYLLYQ
jgi:hypothetical protein